MTIMLTQPAVSIRVGMPTILVDNCARFLFRIKAKASRILKPTYIRCWPKRTGKHYTNNVRLAVQRSGLFKSKRARGGLFVKVEHASFFSLQSNFYTCVKHSTFRQSGFGLQCGQVKLLRSRFGALSITLLPELQVMGQSR